jgi:hypothetical protein
VIQLLITSLLLLMISASNAQPTGHLTQDLGNIVRLHDTIVVGTVKSVYMTGDYRHNRRFAIVVKVTQVLKGRAKQGGDITIFIHSPSEAFGTGDNDLVGRACVFAMNRTEHGFSDVVAPFFAQSFTKKDINHLKAQLK